MKQRTAYIKRKTKETRVELELNIDGGGRYSIDSGLPFLNHMLELFSKHALFDIRLKVKGDLSVDYHHTVEDIGLCLGSALDRALGGRKKIARYGFAFVPMDDSLSRVVVDLGGRPYLVYNVANRKRKILDFDLHLIEEMFRAFSVQARMNLHVAQMYGKDAHHAYESIFKALAKALRAAVTQDPRQKGIPSSKGML